MESVGMTPVSSGSVAANLPGTGSGVAASAASQSANDDSTLSGTSAPASVSQDDAVDISPAGYAAAAADDDGGDEGDGVETDNGGDVVIVIDDPSDPLAAGNTSDSGDTDGETDDGANAQPVRSLVDGVLGLERPDLPADPNDAYSAGRWLAAGLTIGGIVSLLV
ncbi:hypothetical protein [Paraburkholderia acidipaludis]|uniref:hypothetical protein n=1 Tax=Paraburkholderia acidipaludis TaxID=660537 RepID=UPI001FDFCE9C|nr:hypothetical protein [Paraburkholderia acidipaludis]